jgi:hypothetical protein
MRSGMKKIIQEKMNSSKFLWNLFKMIIYNRVQKISLIKCLINKWNKKLMIFKIVEDIILINIAMLNLKVMTPT